ncbi:MAG: hypothetical protein E6G39_15285 [Actinobacteria bacterium]|nr:MAG: hypothetical protein E6G39_15285 [Actinomycetota bacterium]
MLYAFGFEHVGVVVSDLYFADPNPSVGQEGPERGVRLEVRMLERGALKGSIYSARPIGVDRPIWRADLLESVSGPAGSFDRTVPELSADPLGWVGARLSDLPTLLAEAEVDPATVSADDGEALRQAVPEILEAARRLLDRVHAGELARAPHAGSLDSARAGWL